MKKQPKKTNVYDPGTYQVGRSLPTGPRKSVHSNLREPEKPKKKRSKKKIAAIILGFILLFASIFGFLAWDKIKGIFNGSLFDLIAKNEPLERDQFGRSNILVFGTSEDDPGHGGADLADSIMVISVNQDTYDANLLSLPRDLWVKLNSKCPSLGTEQKLNASYKCAMEEYDDEDKASMAFANQVSEIIGTDIQYYAKVNYSVVEGVVNALGGIEVNINSEDPRGIYDVATKVKLSNGKHEIDGHTALMLSRARGHSGGYGLARSNFDRERNQQAIVQGILSKASSTGTLANPAKVLSLFGSLGENIVSNIETKNLKTVVSVANNVKPDMIVQLPLDDKEKPLVITGPYRGVSIVRPKAGVFDYTDIQAYVKEAFAKTTIKESNSN